VSHAEFQARLTAACGLAWRRVAWGISVISVALGGRGPLLDCRFRSGHALAHAALLGRSPGAQPVARPCASWRRLQR
jgi:hypothetical protein